MQSIGGGGKARTSNRTYKTRGQTQALIRFTSVGFHPQLFRDLQTPSDLAALSDL